MKKRGEREGERERRKKGKTWKEKKKLGMFSIKKLNTIEKGKYEEKRWGAVD